MPLAVPASGEHRSGQPAPRGRGGGGAVCHAEALPWQT